MMGSWGFNKRGFSLDVYIVLMLQSFLFFSMFSKAQSTNYVTKKCLDMFGYKPPIIGNSRQYFLEKHQPPTRTPNRRWTNIEHSLQMDGKHFLVCGLDHFLFFHILGIIIPTD
jgi:hypothetical protein